MRSGNRREVCAPTQPAPASWVDLFKKSPFERLTVIGFTGVVTKHGQKMVTCRCSCGSFVDVMKTSLTSGATTSCGCVHSEEVTTRNVAATRHGAAVGHKVNDLYRAWSAIKTRCFNPRSRPYRWYGGRGITMHKPWANAFEAFRDYIEAELGPRPSRRYSIDRVNNDKGYVPGNLRWATPEEQNRNRQGTKLYELVGEFHSLGEWAEIANIRYDTVKSRVVTYDWPLDEALGTPPGFGRCPLKDRRRWTSTEAYQSYLVRDRARARDHVIG